MRCEGYLLITRDVRRSQAFYETVLNAQATLELEKHVVFKGGFSLLQEDDWRVFSEMNSRPCSYAHHTGQLVFETDNIAEFTQKLARFPEIKLLHPLKELPWGRKAIRFYDPDGHVVEVGESMELVIKRFLENGLSIAETALRSEFPEEYVRRCKEEMQSEKINLGTENEEAGERS
ncbi:VOC family protein [Desulfovibrio sp. OttesenSCG-928-G15]|nr:VOC family protein [Desulfovibrio sp. OttesenSCG-928-G15]